MGFQFENNSLVQPPLILNICYGHFTLIVTHYLSDICPTLDLLFEIAEQGLTADSI